MLWVDLSKSFMTFSRAVGQFLEKSRGVHAEVRKAVWSLYSRPHGSFDWAFGCCAHFGSLRGSVQALLPTSWARFPAVQLFTRQHSGILYFSAKGTNETTSPWYSHRVGYRLGTIATHPKVRSHVKAVAASHAARC